MENSNNVDKKSVLEQIDDFFNAQQPSKTNLYFLTVFALIGLLVYQFVFTESDIMLKRAQNTLSSTTQKVNTQRNYIATNSPAMLQQLKQKVINQKDQLDNIIYQISYVDNTLTELSYLLFNDESWAGFVDNVSNLAKKYAVEIKEIGNEFYEPTYQKISQVVAISVKANSKPKNMVKFINAIEESNLVVDVNELNITRPNEFVSAQFNIAVWGMKY